MTGWKLCPREPANAMENAGVDEAANHFGIMVDEGQVSDVWREMHEAAPTPPDEVLERMARAHDREDSAKRGEPSPWDFATDAPDFEEFRAERIAAMRAALSSLTATRSGE